MNSLFKPHMLTWKLPLLQLLLLLLPCWHVASAVQRNERDGCWQHREHVVAVCLDVSLSVCLSLRVGDVSGKCFMPFYRAECAALIRLQVITLSEQVLALDLACAVGAVGAFVSLPIAFLFSHLFLQHFPLPASLLPRPRMCQRRQRLVGQAL